MLGMGQNTDVNNAENSVVEESATEVQDTSTEQVGESAGDVKTEPNEIPENVPYGRFKEVNDKYNSLKEKEEAYSHYEQFDKLLEENSELNDAVTKTVTDYRAGKISKTEATTQIENATENSGGDSGNKSIEGVTFHLYNQEFTGLAKADGYETPEDIATLGAATTTILQQMNPKAFAEFTPGAVNKAYAEAKKMFEGFASRRTKNYIKDKVGEDNPPIVNGTPVTSEKQIMSREDATKHMASGLKQMLKE